VNCNICKDKLFIVKDKIAKPCICVDKQKKYKIWKQSGIPYVYYDLDVSMIDLICGSLEDREINKESFKILDNFKNNFAEISEKNIGLFIKGGHGNGKTLCACDIGKYVSLKRKNNHERYKVFFTTFSGLINIVWGGLSYDPLFSEINTNEEQKRLLFKYWNESDLRIIDDIGKENKTKSGNEASVLDEFVRSNAYTEKKSIIITSNIETNEIEKSYNKSVDSLLNEKIFHLEIIGSDYRKNKYIEQTKENLLKGKV